MFQGWITFEEQFDKNYEKYMRCKELGVSDFTLENEKKRINDYLYLDKRIKEIIALLYKRYKLTEEFLKSIFLPSSAIFKLSDEEIIFRMDYWIKFFGDKTLFFEAVKNETIYHAGQYSVLIGFFSKTNISFASKRVKYLMENFNLSEKSALHFIAYNIYYLEIKTSFFERKLSSYAELLSTDINTIKRMCVRYPSAFGSRIERLEEKIIGLAQAFSIDTDVAKSIMLKFPPLIEYQITQVRNFEVALSKLVDDYANTLIKYPYLINLFDTIEKKYYGLFDNFSELLTDLDFIEQNIGNIEDIVVYDSKYPMLVVNKSKFGYLVCCFGLKQYAPNKNSSQFDIKTYDNFGRTVACLNVSGYEKCYVDYGIKLLLDLLK